ncbi:MAG: nucleoside monophosphate kinase [Candidatus Dependentiae bacterium]|nr:nucleoside monophosphate kinase [Candidatus Dependentiae bacterium]
MNKLQYSFLISTLCFLSVNSQHFVLISAPGSGKGTFCQYMTKKHGYIQICPGDLFRKEILQQTDLGKVIEPIVNAGDYVEEQIVCRLMQQYLQQALNQNKPFILDGFPRSQHSLQFLLAFLTEKQILKNVCFLQMQATDNVCKQRMLGRYVCNACGQVDNAAKMEISENPMCSACGEKLTSRSGDKESVINKRLQHFHTVIEPLLQKLQHDGHTVKIINSVQELSDLERIYDEIAA